MLGALVGAINNDTTTLSARTGIDFPKDLTDEVWLVQPDGELLGQRAPLPHHVAMEQKAC